MNIVNAIRTICEVEKGFNMLFDEKQCMAKMKDLCQDKKDVQLFQKLFHGKAKSSLIELINHVYEYKQKENVVICALQVDGLTLSDAKKAVCIFYEAFGFPGYRNIKKECTIEDGDAHFKIIYKGEVVNGKEYGVGVRRCYYDGKESNIDECIWINGRMIGYCESKDVEFGCFETFKTSFVVEDMMVGSVKNTYASTTYIEDFTPFSA